MPRSAKVPPRHDLRPPPGRFRADRARRRYERRRGHRHGGPYGGDEYLLNGSKIFITNAPYAEVYIVFAKTDPAQGTRGISAFIVEKGTPGFSVGEAEHKLGIRAAQHAAPLLRRLPHPQGCPRLGGEGNGFKIAMQTLDGGRIGVAAQALATAQAALDT